MSVLNALADPSKATTAIFANRLHITATPLSQLSLVIARAPITGDARYVARVFARASAGRQ
jgi:hypothetical protein